MYSALQRVQELVLWRNGANLFAQEELRRSSFFFASGLLSCDLAIQHGGRFTPPTIICLLYTYIVYILLLSFYNSHCSFISIFYCSQFYVIMITIYCHIVDIAHQIFVNIYHRLLRLLNSYMKYNQKIKRLESASQLFYHGVRCLCIHLLVISWLGDSSIL